MRGGRRVRPGPSVESSSIVRMMPKGAAVSVSVKKAMAEDMELCFAIREQVFIQGQSVPRERERDGLDRLCTHFVAWVGCKAMGTARLRVTQDGIAKAERVAVLDAARGAGLGRRLMAALEAEARRLGHDEVLLGAQSYVVPFYELLGYVVEGEEFEDAGIRHRWMRMGWGG